MYLLQKDLGDKSKLFEWFLTAISLYCWKQSFPGDMSLEPGKRLFPTVKQ